MTSPIVVAPETLAAPVPKPKPAITDLIVFYGLFGLLLFGPLAFGAVEPWSIFALELGTALLFLLWAAKYAISPSRRITANPLFLPMLAFGGLILLQLGLARSAYRQETVSRTLLYGAYFMLAFLTAQCLRRASQVKRLTTIASLYGAALAFFALLQGVAPNGKLYWVREPRLGGWIYGPYVNHNHYAGLMEMLIPIPLVFCFTRYAFGTKKTLATLAAALMTGTVFLSGSRGGMLAVTIEIVFFATMVSTRKKRARTVLLVGVFLLGVFGLLAWLGGAELASRLASIHREIHTELTGGTRLAIDRDGLRMFARRPLLGWGLGAFPVVYPQFRSFYTNFFVNEAHNDYLQLLVEMGAAGFGIMLWFLIMLYRRSAAKLGDWGTNINGATSLAALLGCTGILVHSFVDFNLQVPANAALFYVLAVIATSKPLIQSTRRRRSDPLTAEMSSSLHAD